MLAASSPLAVAREENDRQATYPNSDCGKDLEILISVNRERQTAGRRGTKPLISSPECREINPAPDAAARGHKSWEDSFMPVGAKEDERRANTRATPPSGKGRVCWNRSSGTNRTRTAIRAIRGDLRKGGWSRIIRSACEGHLSLRMREHKKRTALPLLNKENLKIKRDLTILIKIDNDKSSGR